MEATIKKITMNLNEALQAYSRRWWQTMEQ